jgi:hypothetical protein
MPITDEHIELFRSIRSEWNKAETDIKTAEQVCLKVVIPAIKELRYAGRRIVDALASLDSGAPTEDINSFLCDAKFDCYRARHDAIDVATSKMAIDIEVMINKLKYSAILPAYPGFPKLFAEITEVRKKIATSRGNRENREAIYSVIESTDFPKLVSRFQEMKSCEQIMKAVAKSERKYKLIAIISLFLAVISLAVNFVPWKELFPTSASSSSQELKL